MRVVAKCKKDAAKQKKRFSIHFSITFCQKQILTFQTVSPTVSPPKLNSWRGMQSQPQTTTRRQKNDPPKLSVRFSVSLEFGQTGCWYQKANPTIHCIYHNSNCCGFPKHHFHILRSLRFSNRFSIISPTISPAVSPSVSPILYCFHASSLGTSFAHPFLHLFLRPFLQEIWRLFFYGVSFPLPIDS